MKSLSISARTALAISISPPQRPSGVARSTAANSSSEVPSRRDDRPWRDRVDQDLVGGQLQRQRLGQRDDAGLGDVVGEEARIARPAAARHPVGEVDDAAAAQPAHVRNRGTRAQPGRRAGRRPSARPSRRRDVVDRRRHVERRHVDEDVEAAEARPPFRRRPARTRPGSRQVGLQHHGPAPQRPHGGRGLLRLRARAVDRPARHRRRRAPARWRPPRRSACRR